MTDAVSGNRNRKSIAEGRAFESSNMLTDSKHDVVSAVTTAQDVQHALTDDDD